MSYK
jgi:hypothetical protein